MMRYESSNPYISTYIQMSITNYVHLFLPLLYLAELPNGLRGAAKLAKGNTNGQIVNPITDRLEAGTELSIPFLIYDFFFFFFFKKDKKERVSSKEQQSGDIHTNSFIFQPFALDN
jgi:hypothetical protein